MFPGSFETVVAILALAAGVAVILVGFIAALLYVVIHFIDRKHEVEHKHKQKDLDATSKKIIKMTKTLSPTICEMAESSVPVEFLPDLIRSVTGSQTSQNNHLEDFALEALKALSSVPKK